MKKKKSWIITSFVLIIVITLLVVFNKNQRQDNQQIEIGAALGLTGDAATWGEATKNGIEMAVDELNKKGVAIKVVYEDTSSNSKQTMSAVSKLTSIDKVKAVIVTWLDVYQGAETLVKDKESMIMISPDAGVEALPYNNNVFSLWYRTEPKAKVLVDFIKSNNNKKLAVVLPKDSYYLTFGKFVEQYCKEVSLDCATSYFVPNNHDVFRTLIAKVKSSKADAIMFASYNEGDSASFFKEVNSQYPKVNVYGEETAKDFMANESIKKYIQQITYLGPRVDDNKFIENYKRKYGIEPVFSASQSYDAVMLIVESLKNNPDNPSLYLRSGLLSSVTYGKFSFDQINGVKSDSSQFKLFTYDNGKVNEVPLN